MMKIDRIQTTMVLTVIMMMCFLLTGCGKSNAFDGTRTSDEAGFWMVYRVLDKEESSDLKLSEGDQIQVSISHSAGYVDVMVGQDGEEPIYDGTWQENADFILTIPETGLYQITVTGHQAEGKISFVCPQKRDREIKARLEEYRTDYIGDAPKVVGIASNLPYPEGFSYRSIEIQSDTEPYGLTVFLDGEGNSTEKDFENASKFAFDYIKNMGTIRFCMEEAKEEVASFER